MKKSAILIALAQAGTLVFAQGTGPAPLDSRSASGASFVCGGVGVNEQQSMKAAANQHDLMLTFAVSNGAYLADVDVEIRRANGPVVLSAKCNGPIMLVDLPSGGSWSVTARANGETRQKTLTAGAGRHAQTTFTWPAGA
ncbi:MAG TPA: hypothetical protein VNS31_12485 [Ramlibacter sp.]|jgi:hypothetical protein|nr:hypothetical protein [Ramlibacter sp.]